MKPNCVEVLMLIGFGCLKEKKRHNMKKPLQRP